MRTVSGRCSTLALAIVLAPYQGSFSFGASRGSITVTRLQ